MERFSEITVTLWEQPTLFKKLLNCLTHVEGSNNYNQNVIFVRINPTNIEVESAYYNEYGGLYGNDDGQVIRKDDLPNYVARKLYGMGK